MAGDRLHIKVDSYVENTTTDNGSANRLNAILAVLSSLINSSSVTTGFHGGGSTVTTNLNNSVPFTSFISPENGGGGTMPKAYLNILFFDEQFNFVSANSEIVQVTTKGSGQTITRISSSAKQAAKSGYAYVFVSNESNNLVYFDNLQITHERGPLIQDQAYSLWGLQLQGISSNSLNFWQPNNKHKFNGYEQQNKEFSDGSGLEWYDYKHRFYDNQIGRFFVQDRLADHYAQYSLYQFAGNEPTVAIDLDGLEPAYIASKNKSGQTKLNIPVVAMYARLYGNSFWTSGGKANLVIDQSIHDRITGYNTGGNAGGAITLGFEINYSGDYATNNNGEGWLKITGHEIAHIQQFIDMFGKGFKSDKDYKKAVGFWVFAYGVDVAAKTFENWTTDPR